MSKAFDILILTLALATTCAHTIAQEATEEYPPGAAQAPNLSPSEGVDPAATGGGDPWLDAVRAQRRAWEERRQTNRDFLDGYRPPGPRAASPAEAHHEEHHQEYLRRREALRERIARDRELFRSQTPWQGAPGPDLPGMEGDLSKPAPPPLPPPPYPPLPGWDNRWYYRGY